MKTGKSNDLMGCIEGSVGHGSFNSSTDAKKGKGASLDSSMYGSMKKSEAAPSVDAGKKGTGATNDMAKINRLANDKRESVTF